MSELIVNVEIYDDDSYNQVTGAVKELAHVFIDMDDFEHAAACIIQLVALQRQHNAAMNPNPPQEP